MRKLILAFLTAFSLAQAQVAHTHAPQGDVWGTRDTVTLVSSDGKVKWSVKLPGLTALKVLVAGEKVLVIHSYAVTALDSLNGKVLWRVTGQPDGSSDGSDTWIIRANNFEC